MIKEFDRNSALSTKQVIINKMKEVEQLLGISIDVKEIKMRSAMTIDFSMTASTTKEAALEETEMGKAFLAYAEFYGFKPEHLGKTFMYKRKMFMVKGLNTRAPKYPVQAEEVATRRLWRFPKSAVLPHMPS